MQIHVAEFNWICGWCGEAVEEGEEVGRAEDETGDWFHLECAEEAAGVERSPEEIAAEAATWLEAHPDALLGERVGWALLAESGGQAGSRVDLERVAERLGSTLENVQAVLQEISEPLK